MCHTLLLPLLKKITLLKIRTLKNRANYVICIYAILNVNTCNCIYFVKKNFKVQQVTLRFINDLDLTEMADRKTIFSCMHAKTKIIFVVTLTGFSCMYEQK